MAEDLKKLIDSKQTQAFIKTTEQPLKGITSEQKVALNRKGNILFNEGKVEEARRVFITTGYSDGLTRVGELDETKNKDLLALKMYLLAHNTKKANPILEKIAGMLKIILKEE